MDAAVGSTASTIGNDLVNRNSQSSVPSLLSSSSTASGSRNGRRPPTTGMEAVKP